MNEVIELVLTGPVGDVRSSTRFEVKNYGLDGEDLAVEALRKEFRKRRNLTEKESHEDQTPDLFQI